MPTSLFLLDLATLLCRYCCHSCYCYYVANVVTLLLLLLLCCYWLLLLLLLSYYLATDTLLQILNLSGVVELTTQLLILENILLLPLLSNQQIWVEYSTLENCCDPLYLWVIKTIFWRRCRGSTTIFSESLGIDVC